MKQIIAKIYAGGLITAAEAMLIAESGSEYSEPILAAADAARIRYAGSCVDLCAIINAKSGKCSEDCTYCSQSSLSSASITRYPLINIDDLKRAASEAASVGVNRFSIVTSGRKPAEDELKIIGRMIEAARSAGLKPCASLGLLGRQELAYLKSSGLERYHNNLETSENFFSKICTTHKYSDKIKTIEAALSVGLSVCSGGIFGLGESWMDRIDMAITLYGLNIDSVPINFLVPVRGTRLEQMPLLSAAEALRIISIYRFLLPAKSIRICGGRMQTLGSMGSIIFEAGADAVMTGNYLTTTGISYEDDIIKIKEKGLVLRV
ncbi:MAG: biotin synthase BioB [Dissulfurispiraceae bacterium]|jgi:biotin synthase|nr:biotin synthase BioB [Dissulfurispiraceae bacterium]